MSAPGKRVLPAKASPLKRFLSVIYWIVFALSLVIVLAFAAFKIFVTPPDVDSQITFNPNVTVTIPNPGSSAAPGSSGSPDNTPAVTELVLTRRQGVYTCLLAGTDDGNGVADTIMLGVFDTNSRTASLVSIPRDTLVRVNGGNYKINATYGIGGMELLCSTVSNMLAVPVDFYVLVDLAAFEKIVNEIDGVWFTVPQDMDYEDPYQDLYIHLKEGYQLLDGSKALQLMRFRHGYSSQDIGRSETQRAFLTALIKQTITLSNITKVTSLIKIVNQYVESNMPLDTMIYFGTQAIGMDLSTALNSTALPGDWVYPVIELRDKDVLALVNSLGIYETHIPAEALNIHHK